MRIQKYISQCGVCSRREAERKILEGDVEVNGVPAEIGQDVNPEADKVSVDGALVRGIVEDKVVLAMNKPKGYICSNGDPFKAQTVFDLLPEPFASMKLFCCGRLDKNSQGLLLLTNDGDLANKITHPSSGVVKRYHVLLNRDLDAKIIPVLLRGVLCDGEKLKASKIIPDSSNLSDSPRRVEVWLNQGRKREIRRMFEAMGYFVKELKRYQIGGLVLKRIPEGAVKILGKADIEKIFSNRHQ
ncbi:pseudouridine synthase [Opitutia bacterium KCR 482]|nr:pseudouridine synthase [Opitutae bacterium KCR 482]MDY5582686.1 pseudouridine synthase [Candidatus Merdousia sp.]